MAMRDLATAGLRGTGESSQCPSKETQAYAYQRDLAPGVSMCTVGCCAICRARPAQSGGGGVSYRQRGTCCKVQATPKRQTPCEVKEPKKSPRPPGPQPRPGSRGRRINSVQCRPAVRHLRVTRPAALQRGQEVGETGSEGHDNHIASRELWSITMDEATRLLT